MFTKIISALMTIILANITFFGWFIGHVYFQAFTTGEYLTFVGKALVALFIIVIAAAIIDTAIRNPEDIPIVGMILLMVVVFIGPMFMTVVSMYKYVSASLLGLEASSTPILIWTGVSVAVALAWTFFRLWLEKKNMQDVSNSEDESDEAEQTTEDCE